MTRGLTARREAVLGIIVGEYIATAAPVASETISRNYQLGVSPATIRNDMAYLEEIGYITRPYTSAGTMPLDRGYRYYVESLTKNVRLPRDEQAHIRNLFNEVEDGFDRWLKLAADLMARLVRNAALVTFPKSSHCQFKHVELVAVHEFLALLILVLSNAVLRRQLLHFNKPMNQEQLTSLANRLNSAYSGLTSSEISTKKLEFLPEQEWIAENIVDIMIAEDETEKDEPYLEGLRLMFGQPEFAQKDRMLDILELMEAKDWFSSALSQRSSDEGVQIVIGEENQTEALRDLSMVFSRYGVPQQLGGTIAVIGPTRMDYQRAISTVGYVSELLSALIAGVCRSE